MALEAMITPRDFCPPYDEWCPPSSPNWEMKRNNLLEKIFQHSIAQVVAVAVPDTRTLEGRFLEQAEKWDRETAHLSSPTQRFANPSYQAILGMGNDHREEVIDLLIRDMEKNRREWFWALSYLTHENPIERKDAGKLDKMIAAWVRWGQRRRGGLR
jgi:hypothetical protein